MSMWGRKSKIKSLSKPLQKVMSDEFLENLNVRVQKNVDSGILLARTCELKRVVTVLGKRHCCNPILVGPTGVGKFTIILGLVQKILRKKVPSFLLKTKVILVDMQAMARNLTPAAMALHVEELISDLNKVKEEKIILVIKNPPLKSASRHAADTSEIVPSLIYSLTQEKNFQCIITTTESNFETLVEKNATLSTTSVTIKIDTPEAKELISITYSATKNLERLHQVSIPFSIVDETIPLIYRYLGENQTPGKVIEILEDACTLTCLRTAGSRSSLNRKLMRLDKKSNFLCEGVEPMLSPITCYQGFSQIYSYIMLAKKCAHVNRWVRFKNFFESHKLSRQPRVDFTSVTEVISERTGIPLTQLNNKDTDKLLNLEQVLHTRIIGQTVAVDRVANAARRAQVGLRDSKRPIASFVFAGTTGVGKTELAKTLAEHLFGGESSMIRFDMSEYMSAYSVSQLIGSPPGYVGCDSGGQLTEKIREKPYSLILFDEMEKAHPDVFNLLLQVLDDGRLTDSRGQVANFSETIIIFTSNVGATELARYVNQQRRIGAAVKYSHMSKLVQDQLEKQYRPEFLNRLDEIIVFTPLTKNEVSQISDLLITKIIKRLQEQGIRLSLTSAFKSFIVEQGYDPNYGARPLRRALSNFLENPLADKLVEDPNIYSVKADIDIYGKIILLTQSKKSEY